MADAVFPELTAFLVAFADPAALRRVHVPDDPGARRPSCGVLDRAAECPVAVCVVHRRR